MGLGAWPNGAEEAPTPTPVELEEEEEEEDEGLFSRLRADGLAPRTTRVSAAGPTWWPLEPDAPAPTTWVGGDEVGRSEPFDSSLVDPIAELRAELLTEDVMPPPLPPPRPP
jgi:hypothetical protein